MKIRAYWQPREEAFEVIVETTFVFFAALTTVHDVFKQWYKQGNKPIPGKEIDFSTKEAVVKQLKKGILKTDDKDPIPERGYRIGSWNGEHGKRSSSIMYTVGALKNPYKFKNVILLTIPEELSSGNPEGVERVKQIIVDLWKPDEIFVDN